MPTLQLNGAELFYEESGHGEPVLLLHGLGSSTVDWQPQIEALSPRYRVIALDARGSGRSRDLRHPGGPFSVPQFASDAAAALDALGAAPAHIVGLSMGGMIAFQLAVDSPRSLRTMTIVNSGPALVPRTPREKLAFVLRRVVSRVLGPKGMGKMLAPRLFPNPGQEPLRRRFRERMARNEKRAYIASQRAIIGWSVADRIGEIDTPTLVIASDQDYGLLSAKEEYVRRMKRAEIAVVRDARHALPIESPERFNPVLVAFLSRHSAAPA